MGVGRRAVNRNREILKGFNEYKDGFVVDVKIVSYLVLEKEGGKEGDG